MLSNIKANIVTQVTPKQIKINRRRIDNVKEIYEISVADFCKLVDALTKGQFIRHIHYHINDDETYSIDPKMSMYRMIKCLLDELDQDHIKQIFGKDSDLDTIEKFVFHISLCKWYTKSFVTLTIKTYIDNNYNFINDTFIRKLNKRG